MKIGLLSDNNIKTQKAYKDLVKKNNFIENPDRLSQTDVIVVLGGDGFMLHSIHENYHLGVPFYGMNCGTVGFLLNKLQTEKLDKIISNAKQTIINPLRMKVKTSDKKFSAIAFNEVSLLRETRQSTNIEIIIDDISRIKTLIADGVLIATPAGSGAYNFSVKGPIMPLNCNLLALTPISPFRPRQWRGALLPDNANIKLIIHNSGKRPVSAVADFKEFRDVKEIEIEKLNKNSVTLLFNHDNNLDDKLLIEQFEY